MLRTNLTLYQAAKGKLWNLLLDEGYATGGKVSDGPWSCEFSDIDQWLQIEQLEVAFNEKYKIAKRYGPEFLTRTDFKEAMQKNPFWIEKRFNECGITIPDALMDDLLHLYSLHERLFLETGGDHEVCESTLRDETINFWVRLQTMGFSTKVFELSESD